MPQSATANGSDSLVWNFRVLGHNALDGFGGKEVETLRKLLSRFLANLETDRE